MRNGLRKTNAGQGAGHSRLKIIRHFIRRSLASEIEMLTGK
jgi:hypothetical protein